MRPSSQCMVTMLVKCIVCAIWLILPLTRVANAWGEGLVSSDSTAIWSNTPKYEGSINGDVTRVSWDHRLTDLLTYKKNITLNASLSINESHYRLQDRMDDNKSLNGSLIVKVSDGLNWSTNVSDGKVFNRIVAFSGDLQDFIVNSTNGSSNLNYIKKFGNGWRVDGRSALSIRRSEKNFKIDKRFRREVGGGAGYSLGRYVSFMGRAYYSNASDNSETKFQKFTGLGETADSLASRIKVNFHEKANIEVTYDRAAKSYRYIDLPRGLYLEQKIDEDEVIRETQTTNSDIYKVIAITRPMRNIELKLTAEHSTQLNDFAIEKKRFSRTVGDIYTGGLKYSWGSSRDMTITTEKKDVLHDLGPLSVSSYDEKQQKITVNLRHEFKPGFSVNARAGATLSQIFYIDFETNPRDRDQSTQHIQATLRSTPFTKVNADVLLSVTSTDYVNIDKSLSATNRRETTYDFRPKFSYRVNERLEIMQSYGLNIEFSDYTFTPSENFLDRNITFSNTVKYKLTRAILVDFHYGLLLHDRGSYLFEEGETERVLRIFDEDRKDQFRVKFSYRINDHLKVLGEQEYSIRRDKSVDTGFESEFPEGGIKLGLEGNYSWGPSKRLTFTMLKVNRFGQFNTKSQNDYWNMRSNLVLGF